MSEQIEGRNAVLEAFRSGKCVDKLFVLDRCQDGPVRTIIREARKKDTIINYVAKERLDQLSETGAHQGVIAQVAAYEYASVEDILAKAREKGEDPFIFILDNIEDPHNLGAIIRTANLAGAHGVIIPKRRAVGLTSTVAKTSAGALNYTPVAKVTNLGHTIDELKANLYDILDDVEKKAQISLDGKVPYTLRDKVIDGKLYVEQGIIAGCAGGGFENICAAADILKGKSIGADAFTLSVYPASTPIYMELAKNGVLAGLLETGAVVKTAFCGPCFGAGDTPANNAFSIRHTTRNFPNREGSKIQNGQISSVALMDARSIAATAANKGFLTSAEDYTGGYTGQKYFFDKTIYDNRVFDSKGIADPGVEIQFGPNIKDWPEMAALPENLIVKVVSEIHDPVTTTDELIPSGETSSYRSNPLGLAEFTLSRKDPAYVGRAKEVQKAQKAIQEGKCPVEALPEMKPVMDVIKKDYPNVSKENLGVGRVRMDMFTTSVKASALRHRLNQMQ